MENLLSITMVEMHICFRQQWCPKMSTKVSIHDYSGWERTQGHAMGREKRWECLVLALPRVLLAFYLAMQNSAFGEYQLSHVFARNMIFLFIDQGWKKSSSGSEAPWSPEQVFLSKDEPFSWELLPPNHVIVLGTWCPSQAGAPHCFWWRKPWF